MRRSPWPGWARSAPAPGASSWARACSRRAFATIPRSSRRPSRHSGTLFPGRVVLGMGTGESLNEVPATGLDWPEQKERTARLREALKLIRALWSEERVSFEGEFYKTRLATIVRPARDSRYRSSWRARARSWPSSRAWRATDSSAPAARSASSTRRPCCPNVQAGLDASGREPGFGLRAHDRDEGVLRHRPCPSRERHALLGRARIETGGTGARRGPHGDGETRGRAADRAHRSRAGSCRAIRTKWRRRSAPTSSSDSIIWYSMRRGPTRRDFSRCSPSRVRVPKAQESVTIWRRRGERLDGGRIWAVVPVKRLAAAKQRLAAALGEAREEFAYLLACRTLEVLQSTGVFAGIIVVTPDPRVAAAARRAARRSWTTTDGSLNRRLHARARLAPRRRGASLAVLLPSDLATLTAESLAAGDSSVPSRCARAGSRAIGLVRCKEGTGHQPGAARARAPFRAVVRSRQLLRGTARGRVRVRMSYASRRCRSTSTRPRISRHCARFGDVSRDRCVVAARDGPSMATLRRRARQASRRWARR